MKLREHSFIGTTQSLCPECLELVPAKIIVKNGRVYFRKRCSTHGVREDFVCSDVRQFDQSQYSTPGKLPLIHGAESKRGCPYDCGLCTEHEQHTCIALLEITSSCNLTCPMCFAGSAPGGKHLTLEQCKRAIDRLVEVEGKPEVLQLSGGEPTIHPDFLEILQYACDQPIDVVMINTNGVRFAKDAEFRDAVAKWRHRAEVYLQFDGFSESHHELLRGKSLLETKLQAVEVLGEVGLNTTLVCTLQAGVNDDQPGPIIRHAIERPHITGVSFQPATYTGRYFLPEQLEDRITFPDVIAAIAEQAGEWFAESDFLPLPCAHPNGHSLAYAYRGNGTTVPLNRFIDIAANMDLLANGIVFTRERAKSLVSQYLARAACGPGGCEPSIAVARPTATETSDDLTQTAQAFFMAAATQTLRQSDLLRITITSFMDAYNFDVRQLMKSCVHHLLPTGHLIPFSAYNVLYRDGHVPLPQLVDVRNDSSPGRQQAPQRPSLPLVSIDER
ncbi:radical SAM protein [Stieleria varia]|uniref:Molybdenum cofactor biosynthesis protein A n=1 Tax=Stieleria varia TaxID=2528005 RepID=A0A5C6A337_9BACT|nr:radical SAM protein [Stieleria varia]TWT93816.1 molybdenum cofactor biosynthesis protein A [Stieleria varia]